MTAYEANAKIQVLDQFQFIAGKRAQRTFQDLSQVNRTDIKRFVMSNLALCVAFQWGRSLFKDFST